MSRGVCEVDAQNNLISINERTSISKTEGKIRYEEMINNLTCQKIQLYP